MSNHFNPEGVKTPLGSVIVDGVVRGLIMGVAWGAVFTENPAIIFFDSPKNPNSSPDPVIYPRKVAVHGAIVEHIKVSCPENYPFGSSSTSWKNVLQSSKGVRYDMLRGGSQY